MLEHCGSVLGRDPGALVRAEMGAGRSAAVAGKPAPIRGWGWRATHRPGVPASIGGMLRTMNAAIRSDIDPALATRLKALLGRQTGLRQAILFGSVAEGTAGAGSDLDIALDFGVRIGPEQKLALIVSLAEVSGRPVDVVDLRAVGEPLLGRILSTGRRMLGSDADFGALIARHLTEVEDFLPLRKRIQDERRQAWIGQ